MKKLFTIILLLFVIAQQMFAVPACPYPVDFKQPDGTAITVMIKGDEKIHWYESMDGYSLLFNQAGYLTYAVLDEGGNLQPSDFIATDVEKRDAVTDSFLNTIEKELFYSDIQQQFMLKVWEIEDEYETRGERGVTGQYKTLCAFVQFPEKSFTKTMNQFENMMNQIGYTGNGTGSVRDFFKESSYDQFDLIITLCGVYTAPNSESYYAGNDGSANCQALARWAAQQVAAEPDINFADYDSNNDGQVDGFHFIFAGRGQEAGGGSSTIWSHKWQFSPSVTKNGKSISIYSCSPELLYSDITTIGVICHEMTHAFGAPDFYDTNYETGGDYSGTGNWDIMAGGSWNGSPGGNCPPHHNMYTKVQFGWVTPIVLSTPTTVTDMPNSAENPVAYRINTPTNNEYYLLDNRQKVGFDASVPGSGLIIYHVHSNVGTSCINCTHPQKMYPVCASSTVAIPTSGPSNYGSINSAGCPFPGTSNKTAFNGTSTPRMFYWTNSVINDKPITEITQNTSAKTVSFKFMGGGISSNANLTSLSVSSGTLVPAFNPSTTNYTVNVAYAVSTISITGVAEDITATVTGNVTNASLNIGSNNFTITVTAQDGTTIKNYQVNVIRAAASSNTNLASLTVNPGTLVPVFNPSTTSYTVNVAYAVATISITGVAEDAYAVVAGNVTNAPLNVGSNSFTIIVTAEDGTTIKNYQINVIRAAANANPNLASLTVSSGALDPTFDPNTISYTVDVANSVTAITITGVPEDPNATVTGNVTDAPLNVGNNNFTITVTAEDGTTIKNYNVEVIRAEGLSSNANLISLTVNPGTLTPAFSPNTTNYTVNVANSVTAITITGEAEDPNATVTGNVTDAPLNVGNNDFTITVTAQDGTTIKNYNVEVIRVNINQFIISSSVEGNVGGAILPEGSIAVNEGEDITFEMLPDDVYVIEYVLVDGEDVGTDAAYTFGNVTSDHTIIVKFKWTASIETVEIQRIRIFPNPTDGLLNLIQDQGTNYELQDGDYSIFNVMGQLMMEGSMQNEITTINVESLPAGMYYLKILGQTKKFVKQ